MTEEQFWDRDCRLTIAYRKAYKLDKKRRNQEMWLLGAYIYKVLLSVAPVYHALAKNPKPEPYLSEPLPIDDKEVKERKERDAKARYEKMLEKTARWKDAVNKKLKGGAEVNG